LTARATIAQKTGVMASSVVEKKTRNSQLDRVRMLHQLLKLTNVLMAPFSTHLADRDLTGVNVMSVSRAVATLERNGRIGVATDPANRRRKVLTLTEEGRRLYDIMRPQSEKVAEYLFSELDGRDVAALERILDRLIETLEARDDSGKWRFLEETRPE